MDVYEEQITGLFRAMDRVRRAWRSVTPCSQLSKSQFGTLMAIQRHRGGPQGGTPEEPGQPITISALAAAMHQSAPALSQRVRALEELGYVQRVPDVTDRRISGVCLTAEGREVLLMAHQRFQCVMSRAIDHLGLEVSEQLIASLLALAEAFESAVSEQDAEEERKAQ